MPLYLVRWPGLRASLVRAHDEIDLIQRLDAEGDPSDCTWTMYGGPVWIDVNMGDVTIQSEGSRPVEAEDVNVGHPDGVVGSLTFSTPEANDYVTEMEDAFIRKAFPRVYKAREAFWGDGFDDPSAVNDAEREKFRKAIVLEVLRHEAKIAEYGMTISDDSTFLRTSNWCYLRNADGTFTRLSVREFQRFAFGRLALKPDGDGQVRAACVVLTPRPGSWDWTAQFAIALRLRTDSDGRIVAAHRADAFATEDGADSPFIYRRAEAVRWQMSEADTAALRKAIGDKIRDREVRWVTEEDPG
jgi:hypothetical protein